jgi:hypothetical protein
MLACEFDKGLVVAAQDLLSQMAAETSVPTAGRKPAEVLLSRTGLPLALAVL